MKQIEKLNVFHPSQTVSAGEHSDIVGIIQIILNTLKVRYDCYDFLDITLTYDDATELAVKCWQKINSFPENGVVDEDVWNSMAVEFSLTRDIE